MTSHASPPGLPTTRRTTSLAVAFPARPGLALAMFMLDVLVIYGLLTYGGLDRHNLGD